MGKKNPRKTRRKAVKAKRVKKIKKALSKTPQNTKSKTQWFLALAQKIQRSKSKKIKSSDGKKKPQNKRQRLTRILLKLSIVGVFVMIVFGIWIFWDLPIAADLSEDQIVSTKIYDRYENLIYEIYADKRRTPIPLDTIPDYVVQATIAIEDKDFYKHPGFSIAGMARALYKNAFRQTLEGGSTLTQQLVKNNLLTPERTMRRKLREFALALAVEARYSKDEILEMYLNEIPYGGTAYGIEAASALYFGKAAKDLNLAEAALLAGLPAAPSRFSPFGSRPELAKGRQEAVLSRMVEDGYISAEEAQSAKEYELSFATPESLKAPHFVLWVKEQLAERYGEAVVEQGGLRVITTLDLELQSLAQDIVKEEVDKLSSQGVGNGAALVARPETGEILAMVGSKDYFAEDEDGKVNIIFATRQPGSSIKPLNYALAIQDKKITASTSMADVPTCFIVVGQSPYCPKNYDGQFRGASQIRFALGNSYNIPAVRVLALNGVEEFIKFATDMGITTFNDPSRYGLSLTLGGGEVRPFDMAVAFSTLANQGVRKPLSAFIKVTDWQGKVLFEKDEIVEGTRVLEPEAAFITSHILHDNNARAAAFGTGSFLVIPGHPEVSVKTGTTNDLRDNWTIGYSPLIVTLSWVGNNDNTPMRGAVSGVSGASPIWNKIMREALQRATNGNYSPEDATRGWPPQPAGVVGALVCANTGSLPTADTADCPTRFEYFVEGTIPEGNVQRRDIPIDKVLNQIAKEGTNPQDIEYRNHLVVFDPLGTMICLDCEYPWPEDTIRYSPPKRDAQ